MTADDQRKAYLQAMGISLWQAREGMLPEPPAAPLASAKTAIATADSLPVSSPLVSWSSLREQVLGCTACALSQSRTQAVFGVGDTQAQWMIIGEAPGRDEDLQGEPFVGAAGQLLNEMLFALGLQREQVYIANILKCRPPNNRDPQPDEVLRCQGYLQQQIQLLKPRVILSVGRISAQHLLQTDTPVGKLRGRVHRVGEQSIPLIVTYHPAYLLRSPLEKRRAWEDLCLAKSVAQENSIA
ncbi:MAG: uracil-DNA glycosylase [Gammaproteobacteria bacterium]|nr:uracil-DNA glycosylase [Gammaproteobacteria bacterium]